MKTNSRKDLLKALDRTVADFACYCLYTKGFENKNIGDWTAMQVLMHVTFWHESFARNLRDLAIGIKTKPVKGTYTALNTHCFKEMGDLSVEEICKRLSNAHEMIGKYVSDPGIKMIPYKVGSRSYSPEEHLEIVNEHIRSHLKDFERADSLRKEGKESL